MMDRRAFLSGALAAPALAASGDRFRIAYSGFPWQERVEEAVETVARHGFAGLEPFRNHVLAYLDKPETLKEKLDEAGIELVTCSNAGKMTIDFLDPAKTKQTIAEHAAFARDFLRVFGCKHFKINLGVRPEGGPTREQLLTMARTLEELGKRTADVGIKLAPHPHVWSPMERFHEVETIVDNTDRNYVGLVADTAHLTLGGMDPVKLIRMYEPRVVALHFKDTAPRYRGHRGPSPTREQHREETLYKILGAGGVDFPAIVSFLRNRRFDGWITMDFDPPRPGAGTIEDQITANKRYLANELDIRLGSA